MRTTIRVSTFASDRGQQAVYVTPKKIVRQMRKNISFRQLFNQCSQGDDDFSALLKNVYISKISPFKLSIYMWLSSSGQPYQYERAFQCVNKSLLSFVSNYEQPYVSAYRTMKYRKVERLQSRITHLDMSPDRIVMNLFRRHHSSNQSSIMAKSLPDTRKISDRLYLTHPMLVQARKDVKLLDRDRRIVPSMKVETGYISQLKLLVIGLFLSVVSSLIVTYFTHLIGTLTTRKQFAAE